MKIRLVSDLHIDVNSKFKVSFLGLEDVFTLVAGDISGYPDMTISWLKNNISKGIFISGNHDVYMKDSRSIESIKEKYHRAFPENSDITYLDNDVGVVSRELEDGTLVVGDVLYTDYALPCFGNEAGDVKNNMFMAVPRMSSGGLNDFVYGRTRNPKYGPVVYQKKRLYYLTPQWYLDHFNRAFEAIDRIVEENNDRNIILMTHHCLHKNCIDDYYVNDSLNASYVSDREKWILDHPNIRLVLSGHVHTRRIFDVGSTKYVLNPLGYCRDQYEMVNRDTNKMEKWTPNVFVDTNTWEVTKEPWENARWDRLCKEYNSMLLKYAGIFM